MMFRLVLLSACVAFCGACTCITRYFPAALCDSSILIRGVVFRGAAIAEGTEGNRYPRVFTVRVDQAFMMPASLRNNQTITIKIPSDSCSYGTRFTLNEDTLFDAYMLQSGVVETGQCSHNTRWNYLSARFQQLLENNDLPQYCANLDTTTSSSSSSSAFDVDTTTERESLLDATVPPRRRHAALGFVTWFFSTVLGWETT